MTTQLQKLTVLKEGTTTTNTSKARKQNTWNGGKEKRNWKEKEWKSQSRKIKRAKQPATLHHGPPRGDKKPFELFLLVFLLLVRNSTVYTEKKEENEPPRWRNMRELEQKQTVSRETKTSSKEKSNKNKTKNHVLLLSHLSVSTVVGLWLNWNPREFFFSCCCCLFSFFFVRFCFYIFFFLPSIFSGLMSVSSSLMFHLFLSPMRCELSCCHLFVKCQRFDFY